MEKPRIPLDLAAQAASEVVSLLIPYAERIIVAGSIRRQKPVVGDIEIVYIPKKGDFHLPGEFFPTLQADLVEARVLELISLGVLAYRIKSDGSHMFGSRVKLLMFVKSNIPLDLFSANTDTWATTLMSRTGGKHNNIMIASKALSMGMEWLPSGTGFRKRDGTLLSINSEEDAYKILGIDYVPPHLRL